MILAGAEDDNRTTLDELFRRAGVRRPDALALIDPPNAAEITGSQPRRLTYAQADRAISAFAARLRALRLPPDSVVAIQLANTVDSVVALLGALRAGMIAAPLLLLWRQQEMIAALLRCGQGDRHLRTRRRERAGRHRHAGARRSVRHSPCLRVLTAVAGRRHAARGHLRRRCGLPACAALRQCRRASRRHHVRRHGRCDTAQPQPVDRRRSRGVSRIRHRRRRDNHVDHSMRLICRPRCRWCDGCSPAAPSSCTMLLMPLCSPSKAARMTPRQSCCRDRCCRRWPRPAYSAGAPPCAVAHT